MPDASQTMQPIAISQLLLDPKNPRLTSVQVNNRDAIRSMIKVQPEHVLGLAKHLIENGLNPAILMIVMPSEDDKKFFYVLDGNRRLTALKLLESPRLAEGILSTKSLQILKRLSDEFEKSPIIRASCVVFKSRDEADTWIQLTHRGLNKGAGMLPWDGQVGARYDELQRGQRNIGLQLLDFVKEYVPLSENTQKKIEDGKFPITTLDRLLSTPYVREKLGIDKTKEDILLFFPKDEVVKGLHRVIEDLASANITVSDLKKQDQRINYINKIDLEELPKPHLVLSEPTSLKRLHEQSSAPVGNASEASHTEKDTSKNNDSNPSKLYDLAPLSAEKSRSQPSPSRKRKTLIPKSCTITINQSRINDLFRELKRLDLTDFSNAGAVMLRVFVELSLDYFIEKKLDWNEHKIGGTPLKDKLGRVAKFMEENKIMTKDELAPIRKAASGDGMLLASVKSMNQYVHNRYYSPVASELVVTWDGFQGFIQNIWDSVE